MSTWQAADQDPARVEAPAEQAGRPAGSDAELEATRPVNVGQGRAEVLYVPLAVTVGDGFKFGCGFTMALVTAMLLGLVLAAALFALGTLTGLSVPVGR